MTEYLPTDFQKYIHISKYSKWDYAKNRRESWPETVNRYFDFFECHLVENKKYYSLDEYNIMRNELEDAILNLKILPSMRALMSAGEALRKNNAAGYNCSFLAIQSIHDFHEMLFLLASGCGVGFSVENKYIQNLPRVPEKIYPTLTTIKVRDSRIGWASAYKELLAMLFNGQEPKYDVSLIRPEGSVLKTMGGRASGPGPLIDLFDFTIKKFHEAKGRKLTDIECHDICCVIAKSIVSGGVRRSALISLSDLESESMAVAKSSNWWETEPQRALANNSAVYEFKPRKDEFKKEWKSIYDSKSGERGIFNRDAARKLVDRANHLRFDAFGDESQVRNISLIVGCNPCSEILLRDKGFCNLTEVVLRNDITKEEIENRVRLATILGTWQSTLTDFDYLRQIWKDNADEEMLLGVSLTGIYDNEYMSTPSKNLASFLRKLKNISIKTNIEIANKFNINKSVAITCVKPSGTAGKLANAAPGIHPRYSKYMIQTVRENKTSPIGKLMKDLKIPCEDDLMNPEKTWVFSFPILGEGNTFTENISAISQLELWKLYQLNYCEHKPSITVNIREHEWDEVGEWCYTNFDILSGVSFLPFEEHSYKQAPWQKTDEKTLSEFIKRFPKIDWNQLMFYEFEDMTEGAQELACSSGVCMI